MLKTRVGLPAVPRLAVAAAALVVASLVLFVAPALINLSGGVGGGTARSSPSAPPASTASLAPTATPAPSPVVYVVKEGDTLSKIAHRFGLSQTDLLAANKNIKNPDKIAIGDQIIIPTAAPSVIEDTISGASPSAPASVSP